MSERLRGTDRSDEDVERRDQNDELRTAVLGEAEAMAELCLIMSQTHFRRAAFWRGWGNGVGLTSAVLAAVTSVAAFSQMPYSNLVAGAIALLLAVLAGTNTFLNPAQRSVRHWSAALAYKALRDEVGDLQRVQAHNPEITSSALAEALKPLRDKLNEVNLDSPQVDVGAPINPDGPYAILGAGKVYGIGGGSNRRARTSPRVN
jgi:hypothetical protein